MASLRGKRAPGGKTKNNAAVIVQRSESSLIGKAQKVACGLAYVGKKLLKSTGKAAWISVTTFLVIGIPLIYAMEREQQLRDLDIQQETLLGVRPETGYGPAM